MREFFFAVLIAVTTYMVLIATGVASKPSFEPAVSELRNPVMEVALKTLSDWHITEKYGKGKGRRRLASFTTDLWEYVSDIETTSSRDAEWKGRFLGYLNDVHEDCVNENLDDNSFVKILRNDKPEIERLREQWYSLGEMKDFSTLEIKRDCKRLRMSADSVLEAGASEEP